MLIFAVDDDEGDLMSLHGAIAEAAPGAEIMDFPLGTEAMTAVETGGLRPEMVFTDIHMPGLDGLALLTRLRRASQEARVVFVTAHPEHALEALRLHAGGMW